VTCIYFHLHVSVSLIKRFQTALKSKLAIFTYLTVKMCHFYTKFGNYEKKMIVFKQVS